MASSSTIPTCSNSEPLLTLRELCCRGRAERSRLSRRGSASAARATRPSCQRCQQPAQGNAACTLAFISQEPDLFGIATLNLTVGYEWDEIGQQMGDPVISLRDGSFEEAHWVVTLPTSAGAGSGSIAPIKPTDDAPSTPMIDVHDSDVAEGTNDS